jgi:DNA polymerase (family 10)
MSGRDGDQGTQRPILSNAEIADRLASLAQILSTKKESFYRAKAYRRAAAIVRTLGESLDELVRDDEDLTRFPGFGKGFAGAIREIVSTGALGSLDKLRSEVSPELASISEHPRLDPKRIGRIYRKLNISSVQALRENLESGEIQKVFGQRMAEHVRQGLIPAEAILLYKADDLRDQVREFLLRIPGVRRSEVTGDSRRRLEVIEELSFVVETNDFPAVVSWLERFGGRTPLVVSRKDMAEFSLSAGILLRIQLAHKKNWGLSLIACTGSKAHLRKLTAVTGSLRTLAANSSFPSEEKFYGNFGLSFIEPELREGNDEVERAKEGELPRLVTIKDIRGELHAHSTSSDGANTIEQMAKAAKDRGYDYLGITDHSQSLKIAGGVSVEDLWAQIHLIDSLNGNLRGFRILKSAEVDILADGAQPVLASQPATVRSGATVAGGCAEDHARARGQVQRGPDQAPGPRWRRGAGGRRLNTSRRGLAVTGRLLVHKPA